MTPPARPETLTVADVAASLEAALDHAALPLPGFEEGCRQAVAYGASCVVCPAERVQLATSLLTGSSTSVVAVATVPAPVSSWAGSRAFTAAASRALEIGADEVALTVTAEDVRGLWASELPARLESAVGLLAAGGAGLRLRFDPAALTDAEAAAVCELARRRRVRTVEPVTDGRDATPLGRVSALRSRLGPDVRLKVGTPVRSLDRLLLLVAAGADLFQGDVAQVLREARDWAGGDGAPIRVPVPGEDFAVGAPTEPAPELRALGSAVDRPQGRA